MASSLITVDMNWRDLTYPFEIGNHYEISTLSKFSELRQYEPQSDDVLDTIKTLVDDGGLDPFDGDSGAVGCYMLPFQDPMFYMLRYAEEAHLDHILAEGLTLFKRAAVYDLPDMIDLALQLLEKILHIVEVRSDSTVTITMFFFIWSVNFSVLHCGHHRPNSDRSSQLQRCAKSFFARPGACLLHDTVYTSFCGPPPFDRGLADIQWSLLWITVLPHQSLLTLDNFRSGLVCDICGGKHVCEHDTCLPLLAEIEMVLNFIVQSWLENLRNSDMDIRSYLKDEADLYLRMPCWARTNLLWEREGNGRVAFRYYGEVAYEASLQFTLDDPELAPSVKVILRDDTIDSIKAEIEKALKEHRNVPGAWVE